MQAPKVPKRAPARRVPSRTQRRGRRRLLRRTPDGQAQPRPNRGARGGRRRNAPRQSEARPWVLAGERSPRPSRPRAKRRRPRRSHRRRAARARRRRDAGGASRNRDPPADRCAAHPGRDDPAALPHGDIGMRSFPGFQCESRRKVEGIESLTEKTAEAVTFERYLPLARHLARRYRGRADVDDLIQVASLGLLKAIERFDPGRGRAFSSFAVPTILGEIKREFRDRGWMVRVPRPMQELKLRLDTITQTLTGELADGRRACRARRRHRGGGARGARRRHRASPDSLDRPLTEER
jgi:RNA polymerase sigma factor (sigma-70 family)